MHLSGTVACTNQVLRKAATTTVMNSTDNKSTHVRITLDSSSQRTYITEKLAKTLKLDLKSPERLSVVTFGSNKPSQIKYRDTSLQLTLKDGSLMRMETSVVPQITGQVKKVLNQCRVCQRMEGNPFKMPRMPLGLRRE